MLNGREKPEEWALDPGLVDLDWEWFWNSKNLYLLPLWAGGGNPRFYPARLSVPSLGGMDWASSKLGLSLENADDDDSVDFSSPYIDMAGWTEASCFFMADVDSYNGTNPAMWRTGTAFGGDTFFIINGTGSGLWVRWGGTDMQNSTAQSIGQNHFGFSTKSGNTRLFSVGRMIEAFSTSYTWPTGTDSQIRGLGWQTTGDQRIDGRHQLLVVAEEHWSDSQHAQLAADPFGMLRMVDDVPAWLSVAAPVSSNPLSRLGLYGGPRGRYDLSLLANKVPPSGVILTRDYYDRMLAG